ncbi:hypothetical protein HPB47_006674, partial [Ixodes persulcatus]
ASQTAKETEPKFFSLTTAMEKFVKVFEEQYKTKVNWTDMWSKTQEMKSLFETKKFYIQVEGGTMKMGDPQTGSGDRSLLYANLYDNESNATQTYTVTHTTMRKERSSVRVSNGFSMGVETSGGVSFKKLFGVGGTVGTKYNSDNTTTDTETKLKTFAVATGVNVPTRRTVQVEWFATMAESNISWTCDITFSGYFAMGLNETFEDTNVLIIPAHYLALANNELEIGGFVTLLAYSVALLHAAPVSGLGDSRAFPSLSGRSSAEISGLSSCEGVESWRELVRPLMTLLTVPLAQVGGRCGRLLERIRRSRGNDEKKEGVWGHEENEANDRQAVRDTSV